MAWAPCCVTSIRRRFAPDRSGPWRDARIAWGRRCTNSSPFVTSNRADILAVLFGPMLAPPPLPTKEQNKILWVPKDPSAGALTLDAHLVGTSENLDIVYGAR